MILLADKAGQQPNPVVEESPDDHAGRVVVLAPAPRDDPSRKPGVCVPAVGVPGRNAVVL